MLKRRSFLAGLLALPAAPVAAKILANPEPKKNKDRIEEKPGFLGARRFDGDGRYAVEISEGHDEIIFVKRDPENDNPTVGRCFSFDKMTGKCGNKWRMYENEFIYDLKCRID